MSWASSNAKTIAELFATTMPCHYTLLTGCQIANLCLYICLCAGSNQAGGVRACSNQAGGARRTNIAAGTKFQLSNEYIRFLLVSLGLFQLRIA